MSGLRITAKLVGSPPTEALTREQMRLKRAATQARDIGGARLKAGVRQDTARALGRRVANTWRYAEYPKGRASSNAAAWLESKAPELVSAHRGALIRAARKTYLAIPSDWTRTIRIGRGRSVGAPSEFPTARFGPLRFLWRGRGEHPVLIADGLRARRTKSGRTSYRKAGKRAIARGEAESRIAFTLVRAVRLPRRIDPDRQFAIARGVFDRAMARRIASA